MYNDIILKLLSEITDEDYLPDNFNENSKVSSIIAGSDDMNQVVITIAKKRIYLSVIGSPYLTAMSKWLQKELIKGCPETLKQKTLSSLIKQFHLPSYRRQDGLLILSLIEQIKAP